MENMSRWRHQQVCCILQGVLKHNVSTKPEVDSIHRFHLGFHKHFLCQLKIKGCLHSSTNQHESVRVICRWQCARQCCAWIASYSMCIWSSIVRRSRGSDCITSLQTHCFRTHNGQRSCRQVWPSHQVPRGHARCMPEIVSTELGILQEPRIVTGAQLMNKWHTLCFTSVWIWFSKKTWSHCVSSHQDQISAYGPEI